MTADGIIRGHLRPLPFRAYEYHGDPGEVRFVEALLLAPVTREPNGDITLSCPMAREGDPLRTAVLCAGRVLVVFGVPGFKFTVLDGAAYKIMCEDASEEHEDDD